jgi:hypothetical protein
MKEPKRFLALTLMTATALAFAASLPLVAQSTAATQSAAQAQRQADRQAQRQAQNQSAQMQLPSDKDIADTQAQFLSLLRLSPVLTSVLARDPSLLADQQYVARNNPELAQFMASHPDIAKNPEFYLFSNLEQGHGHREQALERAVWPDLIPSDRQPGQATMIVNELVPIIIVPVVFLAVVWTIRILVESHRWNRALKLQTEVHGRLIDKFSSSQELAAYMQTEAGKRFLEVSPAAFGADAGVRVPNVVARVLTPLTVGIVLVLSGIGLLLLRNTEPNMTATMLVLGTLGLMPGLGFILSAGATWIVAKRLGMLPEKDDIQGGTPPQLASHDRL